VDNNQEFSADNFKKIFNLKDLRNSRLRFHDDFRRILEKNSDINRISKTIREIYADNTSLSQEKRDEIKQHYSQKKDLESERESMVLNSLKTISEQVCSNEFRFEIFERTIANKKVYFFSPDSVPTYFASKQLQSNVKMSFNVQQSNRDIIIPQIKNLLEGNLKKIVIRTDIRNFYESINRNILMEMLDCESSLSFLSKKMIKNILEKYSELSNSSNGVPRGIGVSAFLSELYLKTFDNQIQKHPNLLYYSRYVDDIFAIFTPSLESNNYINFIGSRLTSLGLDLNSKKTEIIELM